MSETATLRPKMMLLIAVVQGVMLMLLHEAQDSGTWPGESPIWFYPLWTLALAVPVLLLLSLEAGREMRIVKMVSIFAIAISLLAVYLGYNAEPFGEFRLSNLSFVFGASIALACFKALMYIQQRASGTQMSYQALFAYSWRNFLTLALALAFVLAFWLILTLWAELFEVIKIEFFKKLFRMDWFIYPVLGFAHGLGVIIFRNLTNVIDSITKLLQGLIKMLLPLVVFVAAIFVLSLPFVGFATLWDTGTGTALLLWLLAIILFAANAVYQDGREANPYPMFIHRAVYAGICIMPVLSVLSFYGLWTRVDQYGLTVSRCWAFVVWLILALFALGYSQGIVRKRDAWTAELARVNIGMGLVVLAIMLIVNSPLADFRKMSLSSQVARVESGELEWKNFDFWYAERSLGRPAYLKMEELKQTFADSDPELVELIENPRNLRYAGNYRSTKELWAKMQYRPEPFDLPQNIRDKVEKWSINNSQVTQFILIRTDLDADSEFEYVFLLITENRLSYANFFYSDNGNWRTSSVNFNFTRKDSQGVADSLRNGEISVVAPRFSHLRIGDHVLRPIDNGR